MFKLQILHFSVIKLLLWLDCQMHYFASYVSKEVFFLRLTSLAMDDMNFNSRGPFDKPCDL